MTRGIWTDADLAWLRTETDEMIGGYTCTIYREPTGNPEDEPTALYSGIACFYEPERTREVVDAGGSRIVKTPAQIWLAYADLTADPRLLETDFVAAVVDQLDVPRITRAHNIEGVDWFDSHVVVKLAGERS